MPVNYPLAEPPVCVTLEDGLVPDGDVGSLDGSAVEEGLGLGCVGAVVDEGLTTGALLAPVPGVQAAATNLSPLWPHAMSRSPTHVALSRLSIGGAGTSVHRSRTAS